MADSSASDLNSEEAINQLLEAEAQARERMARCEQQAQAQIEEARHQANRILERANERISHLHNLCSITTGRQVNALLQPEHSELRVHNQKQYRETILAAAVQQLAKQLTTPDTEQSQAED